MLADVQEFPFPAKITRRERHEFSKVAGVTLQRLGEIMDTDPASITPEMEAALIMVAVRRVDPSVTFDDVMDHDGWTLGEPVAEAVDESAPLAPPTRLDTSAL